MSIHPCIDCDDKVRPLQQALKCNDYSQSYGLSDHMINFCVVKVFMTLLETKKKFLKLTKYLSKRQVHTKQTMLHFLLETENTSLCC